MSVPLWAAELAGAFWAKARQTESFPRDLRRPIAWAVPLTVVLLPRLSVRGAMAYLERVGLVCEISALDRPLRACLVARNGHGFALIDGTDGEDEQRFSIAHELAHFLRDYWSRRRLTENRLGVNAIEALDGKRSPTKDERLRALLGNVPLRFDVHLMERDDDGNPADWSIAMAERDADLLAYELLAPAEHVLAGAPPGKRELIRTLIDFYGLPEAQATHYAGLLRPPECTDPLILRLRLAAE